MTDYTHHSLLDDNFWHNPETHRQRMEKKQVRALLLANTPVLARGSLYDIKHARIGLGVYEVWLKRRTYS